MKRFVVPFLAVLSFLIPLTAHAEWVTKELKWRISGLGPSGTSTTIFVRDTTYNALGGGASDLGDTTGSFTLDEATVPPRGATLPTAAYAGTGVQGANIAQGDTCTVAWIVIQSDTGVTTAPTATAITMIVDGRIGGFSSPATLARGWVKADSALIDQGAAGTLKIGNETVGLPIRSTSPYGSVFRFGELRARISPATGMMPGARVFLRYFRPDVRERGN